MFKSVPPAAAGGLSQSVSKLKTTSRRSNNSNASGDFVQPPAAAVDTDLIDQTD
jgi:hypothetical protein